MRLDRRACEGQKNLDTVTIRENCSNIRGEIFNGCISLTSIDCYTDKNSFVSDSLVASSIATIRVKSDDDSWDDTINPQTVGGKAGIDVIKNL